MTDGKKILSLLLSHDEANRKLAFQLLESLRAFQEVAKACNHKSVFHFLEVDNARKGADAFFYTKGPFDDAGKSFTFYMFLYFWELKKLPEDSRRRRMVMRSLLDLMSIANPAQTYESKCEALIEHKHDAFRLEINWIVGEQEKSFLDQALEKFELEKDKFLSNVLRDQAPRRKYRIPDPFKDWKILAGSLANNEIDHHYFYQPIQHPEEFYRFNFFVNLARPQFKHILSLLKGSDKETRLSCFENMRIRIKRELGEYLCEYTIFNYVDGRFDKFEFQSQVMLEDEKAIQPALQDMEQIMTPLTPKSALRKLFNQFVVVLNDLAKPQEGLECEIQLTYEATKIVTHFSWPVNDTQKEFLEDVFTKVAKINAQRDQLVDLIDRRIGDPPDPDSKWRLLSKYVKDDDAYQFTIINIQTYAFSLTLEIDL